MLSLLAFRLAG